MKKAFNKIGGHMYSAIETKRLLIRGFKDSDLMTFYYYRQDEEVARYQSWNVTNFLDTKRLFDSIIRNPFDFKKGSTQLAIELKSINHHIGDLYIGIDDKDSSKCFIGYTLSRNYWGNGYAYEATSHFINYLFNETNITEIHAYVLPSNKRSLKLIEKLGFKPFGGIEYCLYKFER